MSDLEAEAVVVKLLEKYWEKFLPHALWSAQNATYGADGNRRPYVCTGVYTQRLRTTRENVPDRIMRILEAARRGWADRLASIEDDDTHRQRTQLIVDYYTREAQSFYQTWFAPKAKEPNSELDS